MGVTSTRPVNELVWLPSPELPRVVYARWQGASSRYRLHWGDGETDRLPQNMAGEHTYRWPGVYEAFAVRDEATERAVAARVVVRASPTFTVNTRLTGGVTVQLDLPHEPEPVLWHIDWGDGVETEHGPGGTPEHTYPWGFGRPDITVTDTPARRTTTVTGPTIEPKPHPGVPRVGFHTTTATTGGSRSEVFRYTGEIGLTGFPPGVEVDCRYLQLTTPNPVRTDQAGAATVTVGGTALTSDWMTVHTYWRDPQEGEARELLQPVNPWLMQQPGVLTYSLHPGDPWRVTLLAETDRPEGHRFTLHTNYQWPGNTPHQLRARPGGWVEATITYPVGTQGARPALVDDTSGVVSTRVIWPLLLSRIEQRPDSVVWWFDYDPFRDCPTETPLRVVIRDGGPGGPVRRVTQMHQTMCSPRFGVQWTLPEPGTYHLTFHGPFAEPTTVTHITRTRSQEPEGVQLIEHSTKETRMGNMSAQFTVAASWDGGYTANYRVTNGGSGEASTWEMSFLLDDPAVVADVWGSGQPKVRARPGTPQPGTITAEAGEPTEPVLALYRYPQSGAPALYVIRCRSPLAPGETTDVGFRVESAGAPARQPHDCSINGAPCASSEQPPPPDEGPDTSPPTQPQGLVVRTAGPRSVTAGWEPSTDDRALEKYDIEVDGDILKTVPAPATSGTVEGLQPETTYRLRVRAVDRAGNQSVWSTSIQAATTSQPEAGDAWGPKVAPFIDMGLWYPEMPPGAGHGGPADLPTFADESGIHAFTLAFITAPGGGNKPEPVWAGQPTYAVRDGWGGDNISALADAGHTPVVSFGGETGRDLAQVADDVDQLTEAYRLVLNAYPQVRHLDFDIEGAAQSDQPSLDRRAAAIARLQRDNPDLRISLTLPVTPEGLTHLGLNVVRTTVNAGVRLSLVNIMAMVFNRHDDMGDLVLRAAESTHAQLREFFPADTGRQRSARLGVCPMVGENNDGAIFSLTHARHLVEQAKAYGIGSLTFWEAGRDRNACMSPALYQCTNIPQNPWDFARVFADYQEV